jgi:hypothetical protein
MHSQHNIHAQYKVFIITFKPFFPAGAASFPRAPPTPLYN